LIFCLVNYDENVYSQTQEKVPWLAPRFRLVRLYEIVYTLSSMSALFADRLRAARQLRGFSQSDLAVKAGLQPSAVSHFETGRRAPSFDNLKMLSDALQVTTDYLLGRVDKPNLTGPVANQLFRHAEKMSKHDLDTLTSFAEMLAKKAAPKKEE
jgi:transcriptional regulator with XRE-family HTH domain